MEITQDERALTDALNRTSRREALLRDARRSWRLSWNDLGSALTAAVFVFLYLKSGEASWLVVFGGALLMWRDKRIESRLDAIVRLLEREV